MMSRQVTGNPTGPAGKAPQGIRLPNASQSTRLSWRSGSNAEVASSGPRRPTGSISSPSSRNASWTTRRPTNQNERSRDRPEEFPGRFHDVDPGAIFYEVPVAGVSVLQDVQLVQDIHQRLGQFSKGPNDFFPVNWPIQLDVSNMELLEQPYVVVPKTTGPRYLLYVDQLGDIYMENNTQQIFQIDEQHAVHLPSRDRSIIIDTVLDGVFTTKIRSDDQSCKFAFVVHDSFRCNGQDLTSRGIEERLDCIQKEVINPRKEALKRKEFDGKSEAFDIDIIPWKDATEVEQFLSEEFIVNWNFKVKHVLFHPRSKPYQSGTCFDILQWTLDPQLEFTFRLKIETDVYGRQQGYLYAIGPKCLEVKFKYLNRAITLSQLDDEVRKFDGKIIDCIFVDDQWHFLHGRTDRNHPNGCRTAKGKLQATTNGVTMESLLSFLQKCKGR